MMRLEAVAKQPLPGGLNPVPDEPLPPQGTLGFRVQLYGMLQRGDLFTARQKFALIRLCRSVSTLDAEPASDGERQEVYCTKVGSTHPEEMYIVGGHMDGHGWNEAANDDGSGRTDLRHHH